MIAPQTIRVPVVDGSDIRFHRLSTTEGLSQPRVAQIVQDDLSSMWFGTQHGLNRYDGYKFKIFKHEPGNSGSLSGVYVYALFKDRAGSLWVGCDQYLDRFDPVKETFNHYRVGGQSNGSAGVTVVHISQDHSDMLWLASRAGLYSFNPANGKTTSYRHDPADPHSLSSNDIKFTGEDKSGTFWVVTTEGLDAFESKSGRATLHIPLHESSESSFYEESFGVLWIIHSSDTGLAVLDRKKNELTHYSFYDHQPVRGRYPGWGPFARIARGIYGSQRRERVY